VRDVIGCDLLRLENGMLVRLQGISIPTATVRPPGFVERLRTAWTTWLSPGYAKMVWFFPDPAPEVGDRADVVAVVRPDRGGPSYNEQALEQGLALFNCRTPRVREFDALVAAARRGQERAEGWWGERPAAPTSLPYLNGAVLGLHGARPVDDGTSLYVERLDELRALGFRHVCLTWASFVDRVDSVRIDRHHPRGVPDDVLLETIAAAKERGLTVLLLPIVLILDPGPDDWRGVLAPRDEAAFWSEYDRFLAHYLDLAEVAGADAFSIGSELGSLEDREATWRRVVRNARGRFRGLLTYSANWDHATTARWFDALDFVGMTAYFALTTMRDATSEDLVRGWRDRAASLARELADLPRPVVFTELGYCSQDGANTAPWNYVMNRDDVDLAEQAACYAAFLEVAESMPFLRGAYFFDVFEEGGARDGGYSPRGKPALAQWQEWAKRRPEGRVQRIAR
jgi:hypothetical protein